MREKIIEKLIERGYNASAIDTVKNQRFRFKK